MKKVLIFLAIITAQAQGSATKAPSKFTINRSNLSPKDLKELDKKITEQLRKLVADDEQEKQEIENLLLLEKQDLQHDVKKTEKIQKLKKQITQLNNQLLQERNKNNTLEEQLNQVKQQSIQGQKDKSTLQKTGDLAYNYRGTLAIIGTVATTYLVHSYIKRSRQSEIDKLLAQEQQNRTEKDSANTRMNLLENQLKNIRKKPEQPSSLWNTVKGWFRKS